MRKILLISFLIISIRVSAQMSIGGQVNNYYAISSVGVNSVTCASEPDLSDLQPGDKVMLFQVTGAMIDTSHSEPVNFPLENGQAPTYHGSGRFELLSVNQVNYPGKVVTFTSDIKRTYNATERVQLIKIVESEIITIDTEVTSLPWNGSKGGVVAIVAFKKLIMNADIDVSADGFRGGVPETYNTGCRPSSSADTFYFKTTDLDRAGFKGEGISKISFPYLKGPGNALNGGGGAIGLYGGGGGGSLYNSGGLGDYQDDGCPSSFSQRPLGGYRLDTGYFARNYELNPDEKWPAFTFGGGGGSSTENAGGSSTSGGKGGGIVLILTDTMISNNHTIRSQGESVTAVATGGAGGGGAGGMVVVDADYISGTLNILINGGDGGDTDNSTGNCGGSGGGGSGGIFWYNGPSKPGAVTYNFLGGLRGNSSCSTNTSENGSQGMLLSYYKPLLNGFAFNAITGDDTICLGQIPNKIVGTKPKGVASPSYTWLESNNDINWTVITGETGKDLQLGSLTTSMYYTRVVENDDGYFDTAYSVYIKVYPVITGNSLSLRDTICSGSQPGLLNANAVSGGNGTYNYIWESTNDSSLPTWTSRSTDEQFEDNSTPDQSTYYRRIVISAGVCFDTSFADTITVLPAILQNILISEDTSICTGLDAGTIAVQSPSGGDGNYSYSWAVSTNGINYIPIGGAIAETYSPGILTDTRYYKRVVYSGNDNACIDSTNSHMVEVLPVISNNSIYSDSVKYCYGDTPLALMGNSSISGGNSSYSYQWHRLNGAIWEPISGAVDVNYFPPSLTDTTSYKRSVISGSDNACKDTSNVLIIQVLPQIINNLQSDPEAICESSLPGVFNELPATEGAGTFSYLWQYRETGSDTWNNASGINNNISYSSGILNTTTDFHRIAFSDICQDTSAGITVTVYPSIKQNEVIGNVQQYVCYSSGKELTGTTPTDGNGIYTYTWLSSEDANSWSALANSDSKNFNTEPLLTGKFFRRIVFSGDLNQCKDTSEYVLVNILELPTGDIVSKPDTLCQQDLIQIEYKNLTGASPWFISIGENSPVRNEIVQEPNGTLTFPMDQTSGLRILTLRDDSTCYADTSLMTGIVNAFVYNLPVAYAGVSKLVCGNQTSLDAEFSVQNSYGNWTIEGGAVSPENSPNGTLTIEEYGIYNIIWRESTSSACYSEDEITIEFFEQPVDINAGPDITEDYSFVHYLNADPTDVGLGHWRFISGDGVLEFDDTTRYNPTVTISDLGTYLIEWRIENGVCESISDELTIINNPQKIYEGFSPNGDDINDEYIVKLQEGHSGELIVLDKNGRKIITVQNTENLIVWDGTNESGIELPEGTYYFILKEDNVSDKAGFIELRRHY